MTTKDAVKEMESLQRPLTAQMWSVRRANCLGVFEKPFPRYFSRNDLKSEGSLLVFLLQEFGKQYHQLSANPGHRLKAKPNGQVRLTACCATTWSVQNPDRGDWGHSRVQWARPMGRMRLLLLSGEPQSAGEETVSLSTGRRRTSRKEERGGGAGAGRWDGDSNSRRRGFLSW